MSSTWEVANVSHELEVLVNQRFNPLNVAEKATLRGKLIDGLAAAERLEHPMGHDCLERRVVEQAIEELGA